MPLDISVKQEKLSFCIKLSKQQKNGRREPPPLSSGNTYEYIYPNLMSRRDGASGRGQPKVLCPDMPSGAFCPFSSYRMNGTLPYTSEVWGGQTGKSFRVVACVVAVWYPTWNFIEIVRAGIFFFPLGPESFPFSSSPPILLSNFSWLYRYVKYIYICIPVIHIHAYDINHV